MKIKDWVHTAQSFAFLESLSARGVSCGMGKLEPVTKVQRTEVTREVTLKKADFSKGT